MGLDIYFYDGDKELDYKHLGITHNLNTLVDELGQLKGKPYYKVIWRPDELFDVENGEVPISLIFPMLQSLIKDLHESKDDLYQYLPQNGWGTMGDLEKFLLEYLGECIKYPNATVYCCR